ncbi:MAG: alpha/beta hydrolase [Candidatus Spechtbacterales bacterium]
MTKTIHLNGVQVHYYDEGSGDAIVILHGWGSSADSWRTVLDDLVGRGFRVVIPDLPGFGRTAEPPSAWGLDEYTDFAHSFIQQCQLAPCTLVGHSFGGRIAIDYATRYGTDVQNVVLIGAAGITRPGGLKRRMSGIAAKVGRALFSLPLLLKARPLAQKIVYRIVGERDYVRSSPRMKEVMSKVLEADLRSALPKITQPTLLLWGALDKTTPVSDARIAQQEVPRATLYIIEGAHHSLQREVPHDVVRAIAAFQEQTT